MKRPIELFLLCLMLFVLSVNGLVAGVLMLISPDGALLQMDPTFLNGSPFSNYLIPGILLFTCIGVLPLLSLIGLIFKPKWRWADSLNVYSDRSWGWTFSLYSGLGTMIWIIVQQFTTRFFILQPVILCLALAIVVLTILPRVILHNNTKNG